MAETVRWSLVISKETDISLRGYLARHGMRKGDLSRFVEDAVRWRVLDRTVAETKAANANVPAEEIEAAIAEAVQAVRADRSPA
ncbi:MAG: ribbon-helix-helix domain-containing protein [Bryobacteraceae bacterium]